MKKAANQKKKQVKKSDVEEKSYFYFDESVKDFIYSDYVRVNSSPKGMLLSFGKAHPELDKFVIVNEVFLPLDVAYHLKQIIEDQLKQQMENGVIQIKEEADESGN